MSRQMLPVGILGVCVLGIVLASSAQDADPFSKANDGPAEKKAETPAGLELSEAQAPTEADLRKALNTKVPVDFEDDPLIDVMKVIAKGAGTNIVVDEAALTEEGVAVDEGVTMKGPALEGARLLDRILKPLGLTWIFEDNVVKVTTIIAAEEKLYTVTYPVGDLLKYGEEHLPDDLAAFQSMPLEYVQFGDCGGGICGGVGGIGGLAAASGPGEWLTDLLQDMTPGPWQDYDGTGGSITLIKNSLSVRQTQKNHELVAKILSTVRDFTQGELPSKASAIRPPHYPLKEDEAVKKALTRVVSMKARDVPLKDFLEHLGMKLEIPTHLYQEALTEEGVAIDEPLNFDLKNLPADSMLKIALEPLGLCHIVDDGRLFVTTIIEAEERLNTVIHDVRDLEEADYSGTALLDLLQSESSGPWEDIDGTGGTARLPLKGLLAVRQTHNVHIQVAAILADVRKQLAEADAPAGKKEPPDPQAVSTKFYGLMGTGDLQAVQQAILTLVEPKSWSKNGGEGEVLLISNLIVVKTKNEVQTKVQEFLKDLEKANAPQMAPFGGGSFGGPAGGGGGLGGGAGGGGGFFRLPADQEKSI